MIQIKTPLNYLNSPGAIAESGKLIASLGKKALVIGGRSALLAAGEPLWQSLARAGVQYDIEQYSGYCTEHAAARFSQTARDAGAQVIVGVGGGRVLDTAKAAGEAAGLAVAAIPTVAGTCAAWSALSIFYDDDGHQTRNLELSASPRAVIIDPIILARAPLRYLRSGIGDTLAKWYEYVPLLRADADSFALKVRLDTSKLALALLERKSLPVLKALEAGKIPADFGELVDAVIFLAGLNGSIKDDAYSPAVAHAVHNGFTYVGDTHGALHGEKVVFGLIVQMLLLREPEDAVTGFIARMLALGLPVTLSQLGIKTDVRQKAHIAAQHVDAAALGLERLGLAVTSEQIEQAILRADALSSESFHESVRAGSGGF